MIYLAVGFLSAATVPLLLVDDSFASACLFPRARYAPNELLVLLFAVEQCRFLTRHAAIILRSFVRSRSLVRLQRKFSAVAAVRTLAPAASLNLSSRLFSAVLSDLFVPGRKSAHDIEREKKGTTCQFLKEPKDLNATALHERRRNFGRCLERPRDSRDKTQPLNGRSRYAVNGQLYTVICSLIVVVETAGRCSPSS